MNGSMSGDGGSGMRASFIGGSGSSTSMSVATFESELIDEEVDFEREKPKEDTKDLSDMDAAKMHERTDWDGSDGLTLHTAEITSAFFFDASQMNDLSLHRLSFPVVHGTRARRCEGCESFDHVCFRSARLDTMFFAQSQQLVLLQAMQCRRIAQNLRRRCHVHLLNVARVLNGWRECGSKSRLNLPFRALQPSRGRASYVIV